jgi:membrane protein DedA with SNARE-associated domain
VEEEFCELRLQGSEKFVAATAGALAGALALYVLGGWGGRGLVLRYSRVLSVRESDPA